MDRIWTMDPVRQRLRRLGQGERREEAVAFLKQFGRETGRSDEATRMRVREVERALSRNGSYAHTAEELAFGARLAWRNHSRCIGRLLWKSLEVRDCRSATTPSAVAQAVFEHARLSYDGGRIRPMVSIFAPAVSAAMPPTIESPQLIQFAGWFADDGKIIGDRRNVELTRVVLAMGWTPPATRSSFDILPLVVRDGDGRRWLFNLPPDLARTVPIAHPLLPRVSGLGLRWYGLPCVANMVLTIGGIDYPCAPFSGHYMSTEIASRSLPDVERFDVLPAFASAAGIDMADPYWRDVALTELNRAVVWSFAEANVRMIDHHQGSAQFLEFVANEQREGRKVSADWSWIVPPQAPPACRVFHLPMRDLGMVPNFYASRHVDGDALRLYRGHERDSRLMRRYNRWKDRWRDWRRRTDWRW